MRKRNGVCVRKRKGACERKRKGVRERKRKGVCVCMAACSAKENRNPKPQNVLNPWHAVKPAFAYACLSIAVIKNPPSACLSNA